MADYRSVQTRMWREDDWFQELDVEARLFWIYLFTNPSASPAGIYRLPLRTMAFESGVRYETAQELMQRFAADGKAHYEDGVLWVVNMRRLQFPTLIDGSKEWQTAIRIQRDIDTIPDRCALKARYLTHSGYPTVYDTVENGKTVKRVSILYPDNDNTLPIPHEYPMNTPSVNRNVTVTETETETQLNDPDFAAAVAAWHSGGQMLSKTIADDIGLAIDDWRERGYPGYVADAITEATRQGKLNWKYVEAILKRCAMDHVSPIKGKNGSDPTGPIVMQTKQVIWADGSTEDREVATRGL